MIVDISHARLVSIGLEHSVETDHVLRGLCLGVPEETVARKQGADDGDYSVGFRRLAHRSDAPHNILEGDLSIVSGDIVDTCQDGNGTGMQVHDVGVETREHMLDGLRTDAPAEIVVVGEEARPVLSPEISDGVAHENHQRALLHFLVGLGIAVETGPVHHTAHLLEILSSSALRSLRKSRREHKRQCQKKYNSFHICNQIISSEPGTKQK